MVLLAGVALLVSACGGGGGGGGTSGASGSGTGVKGGTLRISNIADVDYLDTADGYYTVTAALERTYARTLYSFDITKKGTPDEFTPVPDLSDGPAKVSPDYKVFTFKIRKGVRYAPPVNREVTAQDFVTAVERLYDKTTPSGGQSYGNLIKGAKDFGAGKAKTISGMVASGDTLTITLDKPAPDFLSILFQPFFAPVPKEYASKYKVGSDYSKHIVGSGPYTLKSYVPTKSIELVRNPNWDPATDPLRKAWVDSISVREGLEQEAIQQTLERGDADITLDTQPPNAQLQRLASDPKLKQQFADPISGCLRYLSLGTSPKFGAIANLKVRQAIEYAVDKVATQRARGGSFAGDPASTNLTPTLLGYTKYDMYPTPNSQGDPAKAKQLLAEAGYPNGLTLGYVGVNSGASKQVDTVVQAALARVGITLKVKELSNSAHYTDNLQIPAKRLEHQIGNGGWCPDFAGDGTRSFIVPNFDGRTILPSGNQNYGEYDNPEVNSMIDKALAEPDKTKRGALWSQVDKRIMQDAVWVPYIYDKAPSFWSARTKGWAFTPWFAQPDLTAIWLNPNKP
jgi:peptide/nickel transport system substrate-binding protein